MATTPTAPPPRGDDAGTTAGVCPRCGADYAPFQDYCLECGLRLPHAREPRGAVGERLTFYSRDWVWPVVVTALVAALAAATVIVGRELDEDEPTAILVGDDTPVGMPTVAQTTAPTDTAPTETTPTATTPTAATTTQPPPTTTAPPPPRRVVAWPAGRSGWTIVLSSVPKAGGRAAAVANAREALDAGLQEVGVIDSDQYASLHPDYWVVFAGIYDTQTEANRALAAARSAGYGEAYSRPIEP